MAKKLEDIFNECLERMLQGESIESCLSSYPEEATELEPLLRTAMGFSWRASSIQPRPEFKAQVRARLQGAQVYAKQQSQPQRHGFFAWQRGWAFALTAVLVILIASSGTAAASSGALPDETLYPVKLGTEQLRLTFTFSSEGKANLHAQLVESRAWEIAVMARQGKTEQVVMVTEKLAIQLEETSHAINKAGDVEIKRVLIAPEKATPATDSAPAPALSAYGSEKTEDGNAEQLTESVVAVLENALEDTPEQTRAALRQAIQISKVSYGKAQQKIDTGNGSKKEAENKNKNKIKLAPAEPEPTQYPADEGESKLTPDESRNNQSSTNETKSEPKPVELKKVEPSS